MILALQLPAQPVVVFDPVTHSAHLIETAGKPTAERLEVSTIFMDDLQASAA